MSTSLTDHLRAATPEALATLIRLRPDLVVPVPADLAALAVRAQSRLSLARTLDRLDQFTLEVLEALRYTASLRAPTTDADPTGAGRGPAPDPDPTAVPTTSVTAVLAMTTPVGVDPDRVRRAVTELRDRFVVYGSDAQLHLLRALDEACSPYPAGLGRPAIELDKASAALVCDPVGLRKAVLAASPPERAILDRLAAGPPLGAAAPANLRLGSDSPVRCLIDANLVVRVAEDAVELPREVGLLLRRDTGPLGQLHPNPPEVEAPVRERAAVDQAGAGQAMEVVRYVETLVAATENEPVIQLRHGGIGVRELRRLARIADLEEQTAGLLIEVAWAAGLLGEVAPESSASRSNQVTTYLPAAGFDAWCAGSLAQRWMRLAKAWLVMPRAINLIGTRDDRDRPINALSNEIERPSAPGHRRAVLTALADLAGGTAPSAQQLAGVLHWRTPRRMARFSPDEVAAVLTQAASLGFTGLGALTGYARGLLIDLTELADSSDPQDPLGVLDDAAGNDPVRHLDTLLPAPVDSVLLQADLTVVVPGPADPTLAAELALVAEPESANVHRVTATSIRRALDSGRAAADLHALFAKRSTTPVPQALTYLIDDVARRHGGLRVGSARGYLRSEDETLIAEVFADRKTSALEFRQIAPTVLVTQLVPARMLETLRGAGYAPVAEDSGGAVLLTRARSRRAAARPHLPRPAVDDPLATPMLTPARIAGVVEQIRRGEVAARAARSAPANVRQGAATSGKAAAHAHAEALAVLQQAIRDKAEIWIGYVDAHGAHASRQLRPVSIGGGYLRAEDSRTQTLHTLALHRITAAAFE